MTRRIFISLFALIFSLFSFVSTVSMAKQKEINLVTTEWAPYVNQDKSYHGYTYETVVAAFEQSGYKVNVKFMSWPDALAAVKSGEADGVFPAYLKKEKLADFAFSRPFLGGPVGFYKRRDSAIFVPAELAQADKIDQEAIIDTLTAYDIGIVDGYTNIPAIDNNTKLKKHAVSTDEENLRQLYEGKVQLAVIDQYTAQHILDHRFSQHQAEALTFMQPAITTQQFYLAVAKQGPLAKSILLAFNEGLAEIRQNGILERILDKDARMTGRQIA